MNQARQNKNKKGQTEQSQIWRSAKRHCSFQNSDFQNHDEVYNANTSPLGAGFACQITSCLISFSLLFRVSSEIPWPSGRVSPP